MSKTVPQRSAEREPTRLQRSPARSLLSTQPSLSNAAALSTRTLGSCHTGCQAAVTAGPNNQGKARPYSSVRRKQILLLLIFLQRTLSSPPTNSLLQLLWALWGPFSVWEGLCTTPAAPMGGHLLLSCMEGADT